MVYFVHFAVTKRKNEGKITLRKYYLRELGHPGKCSPP
jgi:hypothetical protein